MARTVAAERGEARLGVLSLPRVGATTIALAVLVVGMSVYLAACGVLLHESYHSFGWDLGMFDQVVWSIANGHGFHYSFRDMSYLGDHFQPVLALLAPLAWLGMGPIPLLVVQAVLFAVAVVPLFAATRRLAGERAAWGVTGAYALSLAVHRAVNFDFHPEAFVPLLTFTALWGLAARKPAVFAAATLALLPVKEDMAFLSLGLCWVAWLAFGERRVARGVAAVAVVYAAVIVLLVMPHIAPDAQRSPILERYPYLGDSHGEIVRNFFLRPDLLIEHIGHPESAETLLLLFASVAFLPLLRPRLLLPLVVLVGLPMLAENDKQQALDLHYGVVPYAFAMVLAAVALRGSSRGGQGASSQEPGASERGSEKAWEQESIAAVLGWARRVAPVALIVAAVALFAWKSPLPPGPSAHLSRFTPGEHAAAADRIVAMVPDGVPVSAQAYFVPHLSHRYTIYEFPRIDEATHLITDDQSDIPSHDRRDYARCRDALPTLGFEVVAQDDGITLYERSPQAAQALGGLDCGQP